MNLWLGPSPLHVYVEGSDVHADHALRLWGRPFLRLHYAMLADQEE